MLAVSLLHVINIFFASIFMIGAQSAKTNNDTFSLYNELIESLNSVMLLAVVLIFSIGILFYIFLKNRTKKVREIVGEENYKKLFNFKKTRARFQKIVNGNGVGTLFLIKINNFDFLNELYGGGIIEQYALDIAEKLSSDSLKGFSFGRTSLSEYIVYISTKISHRDVAEYAAVLFNIVKTPVSLKDIRINSNFNIGIASLEGKGQIHKELMRRANLAMWYSKRQGENNYSIYSTEIDEKFIKEDEIKKELGRALDNNEFELFYQPIFKSSDGSVYGIEALIRWNHPEKGLLKPDYFILEAEKNNMIIEIGYWVIERAFMDFNRILNSFDTDIAGNIRLSINVSPSQLDDKNFLENLRNYILRYNMKPENIVLEITEQVYIQETVNVNELLRKIKEIGCKIAFDDFGIQYSTLSKLNELNFDVVKIDRKFILGLPNDLVCLEIIRMLVSMTSITRKQLIAEGVDSHEQLLKLKELGCDTIQGFYYSQALNIVNVIKRIHESFNKLEKKVDNIKENTEIEEGTKDVNIFEKYMTFFNNCTIPATLNGLIDKGDNKYEIILREINKKYRNEFCITGELVEGKRSEKVYPELNTIRINKIADAVNNLKTLRFPMYYSRNKGTVYDLTIIPLGKDWFSMIFFNKNENSETLSNLHKVKQLYDEKTSLMEVLLKLGETDIWDYDFSNRQLRIMWHSKGNGEDSKDYFIEDYFEMIHPDDKHEFRERFLSFILDNTNKVFNPDNIFTIDYRLSAPSDENWIWVKTNFKIHSYKGRNPEKATAVNINIERYKEYEKEIEFSLCHDSLTNMFNRKGIALGMPVFIKKYKTVAVCIIDLDNFRKANETKGHEYGNEMIIEISRRITESLPDDSFSGRLSGDEFLICLYYESDKKLNALCKKILKKIKFKDEYGIYYSASMGVALYPDHSSDVSELMKYADLELEKAKVESKGEFYIYSNN